MQPLINILIRTSNRPNGFRRLLKSIVAQSYKNIRVIIGYDNEMALTYIPQGLEVYPMIQDRSLPYWYDLYVNQLKELVTEGYFVVIDDDDVLAPECLSRLPLTGDGIIVQLRRENNIVPKDLNFSRGQIGMPCIFLHHSLKNIAHLSGTGSGDYFWIKQVLEHADLPFVNEIVVISFGRGLGRPELPPQTVNYQPS
jgi:hypothetical protein